jgi:hypothetical protein
VKIKFHLNENIEWICNSNQILKLSSNTLNMMETQFNEILILILRLNWIELNTIFFSLTINRVNVLIELSIELNLVDLVSIQIKSNCFFF